MIFILLRFYSPKLWFNFSVSHCSAPNLIFHQKSLIKQTNKSVSHFLPVSKVFNLNLDQ